MLRRVLGLALASLIVAVVGPVLLVLTDATEPVTGPVVAAFGLVELASLAGGVALIPASSHLAESVAIAATASSGSALSLSALTGIAARTLPLKDLEIAEVPETNGWVTPEVEPQRVPGKSGCRARSVGAGSQHVSDDTGRLSYSTGVREVDRHGALIFVGATGRAWKYLWWRTGRVTHTVRINVRCARSGEGCVPLASAVGPTRRSGSNGVVSVEISANISNVGGVERADPVVVIGLTPAVVFSGTVGPPNPVGNPTINPQARRDWVPVSFATLAWTCEAMTQEDHSRGSYAKPRPRSWE